MWSLGSRVRAPSSTPSIINSDMKNEALQRARGVRDFNPAEKIARNKIIEVLKTVFEDFGFNPIETPILERYELFASKYGIGQESDAMRETFKLNDQGNRKIVLRTEFTVPFARFVGTNPQLKMPFKRYQMGQVFRDGPIKLGRYREFWQCDVDVVGIDNPLMDADILQLANTVFKRLNLEVEIQINNRKILNAIMSYAGIEDKDQISVIISIDKMDKIGREGVVAELVEKGISQEKIEKVLETINIQGTNQEKLAALKNLLGENNEGLKEVESAIEYTIDNQNIVFLPSLARGLAYYTGNVFEIYLRDRSQLGSAISAGGRFNDMIGGFVGTGEKFPAVGISFGLETIFDALKILNPEVDGQKCVTKVYVIPVTEAQLVESVKLVNELRQNDIPADIDYLGKKVGKNLEYADAYQIPFALIIGEDEIKSGELTLRNLRTGEQEKLNLEKVIETLKK